MWVINLSLLSLEIALIHRIAAWQPASAEGKGGCCTQEMVVASRRFLETRPLN